MTAAAARSGGQGSAVWERSDRLWENLGAFWEHIVATGLCPPTLVYILAALELVTVEWRFLLKCLLLALRFVRVMLVQCLTISSPYLKKTSGIYAGYGAWATLCWHLTGCAEPARRGFMVPPKELR